jgi:hypothetical protein
MAYFVHGILDLIESLLHILGHKREDFEFLQEVSLILLTDFPEDRSLLVWPPSNGPLST